MKNESRINYLTILNVVRIFSSMVVLIANEAFVLWIEKKLALQYSIILGVILLSLILELLGVLNVIFSIFLIVRFKGIYRKYKSVIITFISIEVILTSYYLIRLLVLSCFAPSMLYFSFPFKLFSLICIILIRIKL